MPKTNLFEEQQDEQIGGLVINADYAKKYEKWRADEELQKLKNKYGEDAELDDGSGNSSSSDSESSDDEPELLSADKDWLRTLALIKAKDSRIYDPAFSCYNSPNLTNLSARHNKNKKNDEPLYLRDYERKMILEAGGIPVDEDDTELGGREDDGIPLSYNDEQLQTKESFKQFLRDDSGDESEPLLKQKKKSGEELEEEEAAYVQWLKGQPDVAVDPKDAKELDPLRRFWNDPKLPEDERFLRDFIFNGGANKEKAASAFDKCDTAAADDLTADEEEVEKQAEFERKYNFRFEEPDPEFIKSYPRTVSDSLRQKDESRAQKREERKKRQNQEKTERREELRQLKKLKREEIVEKLRHLRQIASGATDDDALGAFHSEDLEGDFDPEEHSKMMERIFNSGYYDVAEDMRPDIALSGDEFEQYKDDLQAEAGSDWEEETDVKEEPSDQHQSTADIPELSLIDRPWRRKKSRIGTDLSKEKPIFDPKEKTYDQYLDEYYKLDYEDVVGGMPCRFKYRQVEPIDFGLDAKEVLKARDKELNSWVSIKRVVQYRRPEDDIKDRKRYQQKALHETKKIKIIPSLADTVKNTERNTKTSVAGSSTSRKAESKSDSKTKKQQSGKNPLSGFTDDRLRAYGLEPKKFKYTKHRFLQPSTNPKNKGQKGVKNRPVFA